MGIVAVLQCGHPPLAWVLLAARHSGHLAEPECLPCGRARAATTEEPYVTKLLRGEVDNMLRYLVGLRLAACDVVELRQRLAGQ